MAYIKGMDRSQMCLPEYIDDMVPLDSPVRVIDRFVDSLDMKSLGFQKDAPAETGRPSYDPRDLLKLYIYGYFYKIRSSRKLMQECARNIELFFLLNRITPDFRTIADFRKDNADSISKVFPEFARLCMKLNLYSRELFAIDGSKFRAVAVNGHKWMYNEEILTNKLERIAGKLKEYMARLDHQDQDEGDEDSEEDHSYLAGRISELETRKHLYEEYLAELSESGNTQKLTTDPEARMMHSQKDGFHCCYNVQTAVDSVTHLIGHYSVTNNLNDQGILHKFSEQLGKNMDMPSISVVADKGYDGKDEIEACVMNGIVPYIGFKYDKEERLYTLDYVKADITKKLRQSAKPEDISACLHTGILPSCYENTNISVEVCTEGQVGCFQKSQDQMTVTCPMGFTLRRTKSFKTVYFGPKADCVAVRMNRNIPPVNTPPPDFTPHNAFFRKQRIKQTVLLRIRDDIPKQKERLCISDHPFGTVKWFHGAHYVLCRGIEKTTAELGLSFLAYNLRRAINLKGAIKIVEGIKA